jgi:hypothetical protein
MKLEGARPIEPFAASQREFLVEVYGPLFRRHRPAGPPCVRSAQRLPSLGPTTEYRINKTGIELICQPGDEAIERHSNLDDDYGKSRWR